MSNKTSRPLIIHLHCEGHAHWQKLIIEGVARYRARHQRNWDFLFIQRLNEPTDRFVSEAVDSDGVISAMVIGTEARSILKRRRTPVVFADVDVPGETRVLTDQRAIAKMAFNHLASMGFRRYTFVSDWVTAGIIKQRCDAFRDAVKAAGSSFYEPPVKPYIPQPFNPMRRAQGVEWLAKLPKPLGVFTGGDVQGFRLLTACRAAGIHVPEEVAVIGCDNDEVLCNLSRPPLSSIDHGDINVGYEAAALLDRAMAGEKIDPEPPRILPPVRVIERGSSNVLAVEDPGVSAAMMLIRQNAVQGISARDVLAKVAGSRRRLEIAFRKAMGRSIQEQIHQERIEHAKRLMLETDMTLAEVSSASGYSSTGKLHTHFSSAVGMSPGEYRRKHTSPWVPNE